MKLTRFSNDPVITPNPANQWESFITTNPAAYYDEVSGKVQLLYRAAGDDEAHKIHLGLAQSTDGFHFERTSDQPVMSPLPGFIDGGGIEDPRLIKFGEWYYLTYACRSFPNGKYWLKEKNFKFRPIPDLPQPLCDNGMSTALAFSRDLKEWVRAGLITEPRDDDHDVILFPEKINGRYYYLHRPVFDYEIPCIYLADTDNPLRLKNSRRLAVPLHDWEGQKIGANAPPLRTDAGWLFIYHGVGVDHFYRLGAMLLDLENPDRIIARTHEPIFAPEAWYELKGCHNFEGVVFPCGNIILNGELIVYYGAADKYIGIAHCRLAELTAYMLKYCRTDDTV